MARKQAQIGRVLKEQAKLKAKVHAKPPRGLELMFLQPKKNEFRVFRTQAKNVRSDLFQNSRRH